MSEREKECMGEKESVDVCLREGKRARTCERGRLLSSTCICESANKNEMERERERGQL